MRNLILPLLLLLLIGACGQDQPLIPDIDTEAIIAAPARRYPTPKVKIFYVEGSDRDHSDILEQDIWRIMRESRRFFRDEMDRHGYGRKTFQINTNNRIRVHKVHMERPARFYQNKKKSVTQKELNRFRDPTEGVEKKEICAFFIGFPIENARSFASGMPHYGAIYIMNGRWTHKVVSHELGHVAGLNHDWRNGEHIMSYRFTLRQDGTKRWPANPWTKISPGAAHWLSRSPIFNRPQHVPYSYLGPYISMVQHIEKKGRNRYYMEVSVDSRQDPIYDFAFIEDVSFNVGAGMSVTDYISADEIRWNAGRGLYELRFSAKVPVTTEKIQVVFQNRYGQQDATNTYPWNL